MRSTRLLLIAIAVVALLFTLPLWGSPQLMRLLIEFIYLLALAQMWNLLAGYAGLGSVGLVYGLMRSKTGLGLTAIRDNEAAAASLGLTLIRPSY